MRSSLLKSLLRASYMAGAALATLVAVPAQATPLDESLITGTMSGMQPVEPFALPVTGYGMIDGTPGDMSAYAGDVVVLNFWATWCAPCRAEMPSLQALQDTLGDEGLEVVTMAFGRHNPMAISRFWAELGLTDLPTHLDADTSMAKGLGVVGLPHTFVLDRDGQVIAQLRGEADWAAPETVALMRSILAE
ncbi:MAG: TlpA disulfide reductase family protein [Pseudomonadota bacterium]